jgi:addiction module RelE/StbE family toxin
LEVRWSELAKADRNHIFDYIDADNPAAAISVDERIWAAISGLQRFPEKGRPGRIQGTRELVLTGTPYLAAYMIKGEVVFVLRVFHGAQRWPRQIAVPYVK